MHTRYIARAPEDWTATSMLTQHTHTVYDTALRLLRPIATRVQKQHARALCVRLVRRQGEGAWGVLWCLFSPTVCLLGARCEVSLRVGS